jgi:acetyl-CoA C-acetyltransferase
MAKRWQIKRLAQDELTLTSHQRLDAAYKRGFFDDLISPYRGLARQQPARRHKPGETRRSGPSL